MKIILKYILNSAKEKKLRTLVMLLSVTLSTTLLFVSFGIGDSYESAQRKMAIGYAGNARIVVSPRQEDGTQWITKAQIPVLDGVKSMAGILTARGLYAQDGYYENFDILSADLDDIEAINAPRVQNGDLSEFFGYQIALPDRFANKYGTQVGDAIQIKINDRNYEFVVAAICAYDTIFLRSTRGFNVLIPFETMSAVLGSDGAYSEMLIVPEDGVDRATQKNILSESMDSDVFRVSSVYSESAVEADAKQKSIPFYLISFFTLTISVFIIYSSYKIIMSERLPVIGTFRSIGANEKMMKKILMAESLVYGLSGSILGIPLGYLTMKFLLYGMSDTTSFGIEIPMVVSALNILISCGIAIVVSVLGAYIPVKRASKLPIKELVLGTVEEKQISNIWVLLSGLVLFIASIILPRVTNDNLLMLAGGISLLTLIVGAIIIIPLLMNAASYILEKIYGALFGNIGRLAARNLRDNKNINQNTTLLFISISAIIVISVVGNFVNVYIGDVFRGATLDGFSDSTVDAAFIEEVEDLDTVTDVLPIYVLDSTVLVNGQSMRIEATDDISLFNEMLAIRYTNMEQEYVEKTFNSGRNIVMSSLAIHTAGAQVGDKLTLSGNSEAFEYTIIGTFKSRANDVAIVLSSDNAETDFEPVNYGFFAYKAEDPEGVMIQIRDMLGDQQHWSRTVEEYTNDALDTINAFLSPLNKLTYFILLLAVIGVINNLLINYIQKKHSIAMYKSVGLSNWQNIKMALISGFSVGIIGALLGVFVSYLEIKTVFLVAGPKISIEPEFEFAIFIYAALMGIVITLAGSAAPIIKGTKMNLVEEIKFK